MDLEVAGQWRRQWAGTAEYGKVIEGGVTRKIARAMEVMHASAPGARVRVMRAAYHSTAAPGRPAESYMVHSSRRVISSGFNFLESPTSPTKPLEIASIPLDPNTDDSNVEGENYKVTEPDDTEISEPSKWRGSTGRGSVRMPSEESSSADNVSIIDLDIRHRNNRKSSFDSENSDMSSIRRGTARESPLLDTPVTLSTLKYKSLLNSNSDWNNRRKSYSFEDTSPLHESLPFKNDKLAMESSTDSGICKSSELVNDQPEDPFKYFDRRDKHEDTFNVWLAKTRPNSFFNSLYKSHRDHSIVMEDPSENNIALKSAGKVSITVPITLEDEDYHKKSSMDENDRKTKRVEFCKTELHFAAESGKVNIIATDEKPPPSTDFRKRRSAFVPMRDKFERPITLFGDREDILSKPTKFLELSSLTDSDFCESDENTAATKSILKNKIPKPKPYLLGENMAFGSPENSTYEDSWNLNSGVPSAVSLINRQLQERRNSFEATSNYSNTDVSRNRLSAFRATNKSPTAFQSLKHVETLFQDKDEKATTKVETKTDRSVKDKLKILQMSPTEGKARTRKLRESELTYFGVEKEQTPFQINEAPRNSNNFERSSNDDSFSSVKLVQRISNSVCNSEAESEDAPEYQNVPLKTNFAPIPTPRTRTKYPDKPISTERVLKSIKEQSKSGRHEIETRRPRLRRQDTTASNRSISAPPKDKISPIRGHQNKNDIARETPTRRSFRHISNRDDDKINTRKTRVIDIETYKEEDPPIYVNLNVEKTIHPTTHAKTSKKNELHIKSVNQSPINSERKSSNKRETQESIDTTEPTCTGRTENKNTDSSTRRLDTSKISSGKKWTEKLVTPDRTNSHRRTNKELDSESRKRSKESRSKSSDVHKKSDRSVERGKLRTKDDHPSSKGTHSKTKTEDLKQINSTSKKESVRANNYEYDSTDTKPSQNTVSSKRNERHDTHNYSHKSGKENQKRREYVINYDDKNGTVSSICKIKPAPGSNKRKMVSKEQVIKEDDAKPIKMQPPAHEWNSYGYHSTKRKLKTGAYAQRTCQVL